MAIGFDAVSQGGPTTGTTLTWAHTVGVGADRVIFVGITGAAILHDRDTISVTYGGVPLECIQTYEAFFGASVWFELWWIQNPPSGAANIVATYGASRSHTGVAASYMGSSQSGVWGDEFTYGEDGLSDLSINVPGVVENSWILTLVETPAPATLGYSGVTERQRNGILSLADSNGAVSAVDNTVTVTTDFIDITMMALSFGASDANGDGGISAHEEYDHTTLGF